MQEMVELSKSQSSDTLPQAVKFISKGESVTLSAGPAHFGKQLTSNDEVSHFTSSFTFSTDSRLKC